MSKQLFVLVGGPFHNQPVPERRPEHSERQDEIVMLKEFDYTTAYQSLTTIPGPFAPNYERHVYRLLAVATGTEPTEAVLMWVWYGRR